MTNKPAPASSQDAVSTFADRIESALADWDLQQLDRCSEPEPLLAFADRWRIDATLVALRAQRRAEDLQAQRKHDASSWQRAERDNSAEAYRAYLEGQPDGAYRTEAEQRLFVLDEAHAWSVTESDGSGEGLRRFLTTWDEGARAEEARRKLRSASRGKAWSWRTAATGTVVIGVGLAAVGGLASFGFVVPALWQPTSETAARSAHTATADTKPEEPAVVVAVRPAPLEVAVADVVVQAPIATPGAEANDDEHASSLVRARALVESFSGHLPAAAPVDRPSDKVSGGGPVPPPAPVLSAPSSQAAPAAPVASGAASWSRPLQTGSVEIIRPIDDGGHGRTNVASAPPGVPAIAGPTSTVPVVTAPALPQPARAALGTLAMDVKPAHQPERPAASVPKATEPPSAQLRPKTVLEVLSPTAPTPHIERAPVLVSGPKPATPPVARPVAPHGHPGSSNAGSSNSGSSPHLVAAPVQVHRPATPVVANVLQGRTTQPPRPNQQARVSTRIPLSPLEATMWSLPVAAPAVAKPALKATVAAIRKPAALRPNRPAKSGATEPVWTRGFFEQ